MTTLISLILIPLDLIAADWTIKWAKMSAAAGECLGNDNRGSRRQRRARLRGTLVLEECLSNERWQQVTEFPLGRRG